MGSPNIPTTFILPDIFMLSFPEPRGYCAPSLYPFLSDGKVLLPTRNALRLLSFPQTRPLYPYHILDFAGSIYGKDIRVWFAERVRDEGRFGSGEELSRQIKKDIEKARNILLVPENLT